MNSTKYAVYQAKWDTYFGPITLTKSSEFTSIDEARSHIKKQSPNDQLLLVEYKIDYSNSEQKYIGKLIGFKSSGSSDLIGNFNNK